MTTPSNFASVKLPASLVQQAREKPPSPCAARSQARSNTGGPPSAGWSSIPA